MLNGDVNAFVETIYTGTDLVFWFDGKKYFLQGYVENGTSNLYLDQLDPPGTDYVWVGIGKPGKYPVQEFLEARLWNGKNFWEVQEEMEWVDC